MRAAALAWMVIVIGGIVGWVMNIVQLVQLAQLDGGINGLFVLKALGVIVAPLGAILGYVGT